MKTTLRFPAQLPALAVLALVGAACGGGGAAPSPGVEAGTITVGYGNNLTGFLAVHDHVISDGAKVEVDEINARGGIGGKVKIDLIIEDTKTDPGVSVQVAKDFVAKKVDVMVLPCNTDFQVAMAAVAQPANIFTISPCNADPTLGSKFSIYWPVGMAGNAQLAQLADYAKGKGYSKAYVLDAPDFLYIHLMTKYFEKAASSRGITIVGTDTIKVGPTDFSAQVTKIKAASPAPDVIMTGLFTPFVDALAKQLRAAGVATPVIGTDGMDTGLDLQAGGSAVEGNAFTTFGFPSPGSPLTAFYDKMQATAGARPDGSFAALGAAAIQVLEAAVLKAGSAKPDKIQAALAGGLTVHTVLGDIVYKGSNNHNPVDPVAVVAIANGQFQLVTESVPGNLPEP